jgi:peptidoglycan/LPS O-acetylase OafA/YrhL
MQEIRSLTGLRGIAAIWVLLFHAFYCPPFHGSPLDWVSATGWLGVDLFFVLSGFVLAYNYSGWAWSPGSYFSFLRRRFARIYPAHAFMLLVFVIAVWLTGLIGRPFMSSGNTGSVDLVRSFLLLQGWDTESRYPWNGPSWTISLEWAAYMTFPLIVWIALRLRTAAAVFLLLLGVYLFYLIWARFLPIIDLGLVGRLPLLTANFCAGVLLWRMTTLSPPTRFDGRLAGFALVLLIFGSSASYLTTYANFNAERFAVVSAALVYFVTRSEGWIARWLSTPWMNYLGRISYSLYLVHILFMYLSDLIIPGSRWKWPIRIGAVALAFLAAHLLYTWIEEPCRKVIARSRVPADRGAQAGFSNTVIRSS